VSDAGLPGIVLGFEVRAGRSGEVVPLAEGPRELPGLWWVATSGCHVGFESWAERDVAMMLDFDPLVMAFLVGPDGLKAAVTELENGPYGEDPWSKLVEVITLDQAARAFLD
jgi:hypothetical protein